MASAQVVETSVNTNSSPFQDYTTNPDDHSNHNIDSPGFKPFTVIFTLHYLIHVGYTTVSIVKIRSTGHFQIIAASVSGNILVGSRNGVRKCSKCLKIR